MPKLGTDIPTHFPARFQVWCEAILTDLGESAQALANHLGDVRLSSVWSLEVLVSVAVLEVSLIPGPCRS